MKKYARQRNSLVRFDTLLPHFSSHPMSLALVVLEAERLEYLGDGCHQSHAITDVMANYKLVNHVHVDAYIGASTCKRGQAKIAQL